MNESLTAKTATSDENQNWQKPGLWSENVKKMKISWTNWKPFISFQIQGSFLLPSTLFTIVLSVSATYSKASSVGFPKPPSRSASSAGGSQKGSYFSLGGDPDRLTKPDPNCDKETYHKCRLTSLPSRHLWVKTKSVENTTCVVQIVCLIGLTNRTRVSRGQKGHLRKSSLTLVTAKAKTAPATRARLFREYLHIPIPIKVRCKGHVLGHTHWLILSIS